MNLLDENFPADQTPLLKAWRIRFPRIGRDVGRFGVQDPDIIPLLHQIRGVTLFTQDKGLFNRALCHSQASRMGLVIRAYHEGLEFWEQNRAALRRMPWHDLTQSP